MAKPVAGSIYAKLENPELREDIFCRLLIEGQSFEKVAKDLTKDGIKTSKSALHRMVESEGLLWRTERAGRGGEQLNKIDLTGLSEKARLAIRLQLHNATFENLSIKEMVLLKRTDLEEEKLEVKKRELTLATDKFQWDAASRVFKAARENPSLLRELASDTSLTEDQRITRLVESLWGNPEGGVAA